MSHYFFLSYARSDDREDALVSEFYESLRNAVARKVPDPGAESIAYLDRENLQPGEPWPEGLADGLRRSKTFVFIMTRRYFDRTPCGQEWTIFENRCRDFAAEHPELEGDAPPLFIPVLWDLPEEGEVPRSSAAR